MRTEALETSFTSHLRNLPLKKQEIQLLKNNDNPKLRPWYSEKQAAMLSTPEWDFTGNQLMRFK